jgi:hypothetical protein
MPVALGNRLDRESQLIGVIAKAVGRARFPLLQGGCLNPDNTTAVISIAPRGFWPPLHVGFCSQEL